MARDKQTRLKEKTLKVVRIFAGEMQMATGDNITDDMAIYEMFKLYRPDLIERLAEIEESQPEKSDE